MNEIVIGTTNVSIKEYKGQRVVTLSDIDTVHGRPKGTARKRFNDNKGHFIYGEDYFKVQPSENRTVGIASPNGGIVLTESGYLMIVKSFTDNKAWDVQRALVKSYFRAKQEKPPQYEQLKLEEKPYEYIDKFYKGQPVLTSADVEHFSGINHTRIDYALRNVCTEHKDYEYIADDKLVEFKKENPKYMRSASRLFVIFKSGFDKLVRHFGIKVETPKIMIEEKTIKDYYKPSILPTDDDYITALNVLKHVKMCAKLAESKPSTQRALDVAISFCAVALGEVSAINYCKS
ncbi:MAG: ORF6N domain-containing protein [Oscillospiraceae bacterium]|nr:ORF6N domain-containing protein [Oscillospiraceae bacterium]